MNIIKVLSEREKDWFTYFSKMLEAIRSKSKDPRTKVGCLIYDNEKNILSTGYNGFPRGSNDDEPSRQEGEVKYAFVCHAERNAITLAAYRGQALKDSNLCVDWIPCNECMKSIIQCGVKNIYIIVSEKEFNERLEYWNKRWKDSMITSLIMSRECGVKINVVIDYTVFHFTLEDLQNE